jgi:proteic killer suppression protein
VHNAAAGADLISACVGRVKAFQGFERQAMLRLDRLHAADRLMALNTPGNRLEALKGDRKRQYSIRINDQWRIWYEK